MPNYKRTYGKPITCQKCGLSGGTLVKVGDHYEHQDKAKCKILQVRRIV